MTRSLMALGAIALAVLVYACVQQAGPRLVAPPQIADAEFVGTEECADCHADKVEHFSTATHAVLVVESANATEIGCESCHGPGSLHTESGGEDGTIINPKDSPETCFQCHLDKRADFALPYTHPVTGGALGLTTSRMTCSNCHEPHQGPAIAGGGTAMASQGDTCTQCHIAQRGPFVYEHEALREGCTTCHRPHGSPNPKMLTERNQTLCLKCHFQEQTDSTTILIGGRNHSNLLSRGTCASTGCHEAVHGSNTSSSLVF